jgi:hypothetical protein
MVRLYLENNFKIQRIKTAINPVKMLIQIKNKKYGTKNI